MDQKRILALLYRERCAGCLEIEWDDRGHVGKSQIVVEEFDEIASKIS